MCNVEHRGPVVLLQIECDLDHVSDHDDVSVGMERLTIGDPLRAAQSLCEASMDLAVMQAVKLKELETKTAGMEMELGEKGKRLEKKQGMFLSLTKRVGRLEGRVKELSALSKRHRAQIQELQKGLNHIKNDIAVLERQIREMDPGQA
ncbi:hypothetical protein GGI18_004702 [Coemansia linderi]|uniref:Uncharacterized protein n=1 Tax=Coemansia linderi TaxID=2663919 RepID=A0ACC1K530_9FUNG|nr:hypothetical protein GGI18_004702 [Coemansia linderi]